MSIERSRKSSDRHQAANVAPRKSLRERLQGNQRGLRSLKRRSLLESLEARHLMAGPQLVGIQQNSAQLLTEGAILSKSPNELVFKFDDAVSVGSLQGIQISQVSSTNAKDQATALTDLGTAGVQRLELRAVASGAVGNGLRVNFTSSNRLSSVPGISVSGDRQAITIDLSNNSARLTTIQQVISALNSSPVAGALVNAFSVQGNTAAFIDPSRLTATSLTLRGASSAQASNDLGVGSSTSVRFVATSPGATGGGISVKLERVNVGGAMTPLVFVNNTTITVRVNSTPGQESTIKDLVDALNTNPDSSRLITTTLESGLPTTRIGSIATLPRTISLLTPSDTTIRPGYVGLGATDHEVVFRFTDPLPWGQYKIDILGSGAFALEGTTGEAYNDGISTSQSFRIDSAPEVLAVVPEPVITANGIKQPDVGKIYVYLSNPEAFTSGTAEQNQRALASITNTRNYQLYFTNDTLGASDDSTVQYPTSVDTSGLSNGLVKLNFASPLSRVARPGGGFYTGSANLRIGDAFTRPAAPTVVTVNADPGDSFSTAFPVTTPALNLTPALSNGSSAVTISGNIENSPTAIIPAYPGTGIAGTRRLRPEDAGRANGTFPLDAISGSADENGIRTIRYQFPLTFKGNDPALSGDDVRKTYFNLISSIQKERVREVLSSFSQYLGVQFIEDDQAKSAFQIAVGDLYGADPRVVSEPGGLAVATNKYIKSSVPDAANFSDLVVMDFQDFEQSDDDQFGGEFFRGAMLAVGQLLGYGDGTALPGSSTQSTAAVFDRFIGRTILGEDPIALNNAGTASNGELSNAEISIEVTRVPGVTPVTEVVFQTNQAAATPIPTFTIQGSRLTITLSSNKAGQGSPNLTSLANLLALNANNPAVVAQKLPANIQITAVRGLLPNAGSRGSLIGNASPHTLQLSPSSAQASFPSVVDIVNGQYLYRPDSVDVDLYRFTVNPIGNQRSVKLSIETIAERSTLSSTLNTQLRLFRVNADGTLEEISQNDDYFSDDSLIEIDNLAAGDYVLGVSASGNGAYNPNIPGSGTGGLTQGHYDLRITTTATSADGIRTATNRLLDGDRDGQEGGIFNFWFVPTDPSNTIYVDKSASPTVDLVPDDAVARRDSRYNDFGSIGKPFNELDDAIEAAERRGIRNIRVLSNGGVDGKLETIEDNFSYQVGFASNGNNLPDGTSLELPKGVNLIIEAGAIFKMRSSRVGVGSTTPLVDRSNSSIQVLGTPFLLDSNGFAAVNAAGQKVSGSVYFTSLNTRASAPNPVNAIGMGNSATTGLDPVAGDWGGLDLRSDVDFADLSRVNLENQGIFLNHVQFADLRYGGGQVRVDGRSVVVSPFEMALTRATLINSAISHSADAAVSASPDTFRESRFTEPFFQQAGSFVPTVERIGPEIHGNQLTDNSINGLFIRVKTRTGEVLQPLTVQARFDDTDIVHVLTENLEVRGTPGGSIAPSPAPSSLAIRTQPGVGGGSVPAGTYRYVVSFASESSESLASEATVDVVLTNTGRVQLDQLPTVPVNSDFTMRKLYRATVTGAVASEYKLVASLNSSDTSYVDTRAAGTTDVPTASRLSARLNARLKMDAGTIVKVGGARLDITMGGDLLAEGDRSRPIVLTSINDVRYGGSGAFNTAALSNNTGNATLKAGDWGGVYVGSGASASIDSAVIAGAGGSTRIEGGFASFNAIEVHQGELRLANSKLEEIADGRGTVRTIDAARAGRGDNASGAIFVNNAQPVIVNNRFISTHGPVMTFDVNSFGWQNVEDPGRSTGRSDDQRMERIGNSGPLLSGNRIDNSKLVGTASSTDDIQKIPAINGLEVRGGTVATEVVWDDVDIVHVVRDTISIPNQYVYGGMRLQSDSRGSLVVKFTDTAPAVPTQDTQAVLERNAGIVAGGTVLSAASQFVDIADRIGGSLQIIGAPDYPVVLTALTDDTIGAGFMSDTDNNGIRSTELTSGSTTSQPSSTLPFSQPYSAQPDNGINGLTIDNDVPAANIGSLALNNVGPAGQVATVRATYADPNSNPTRFLPVNPQVLNFLWNTYVDIDSLTPTPGPNLAPVNLANSIITQVPTLVTADRVESSGSVLVIDQDGDGAVDAGDITLNWQAQTFLYDNRGYAYTTISYSMSDERDFNAIRLSNSAPVSFTFRILNGLDMNVGVATDDELYPVGTPGASDFRAVVLDSVNKVGFSHGGIYTDDNVNQVNATYAGWAAGVNQQYAAAANLENVAFTRNGLIAPAQNTAGVTIPNNSTVYGPGDISTVFAWNLNGPSRNARVTTFVEFIPFDPNANLAITPPNANDQAGSWTGLTIREAANDRNVSSVTESETRFSNRVQSNAIPSEAQFLGELAPNLTSGDENRRLGFSINGSILTNQDRDVYSFVGVAGTQVWLDIDRTTSSLDSVIELIDVNGNILALSDDSLQESRGTMSRFRSSSLQSTAVGSLNQFDLPAGSPSSAYSDSFSTNAKDAGMRITLPGSAGQRSLYHIRVRSSNFNVVGTDAERLSQLTNPQLVTQGRSAGSYQLQIRLREQDESVGTQIRQGDVRYARTGIEIIGGPLHSPLIGDDYETADNNDVFANAQPLGLYSVAVDAVAFAGLNATGIGPLSSDRLSKTVGGALSNATDVDWFKFDVNYQNTVGVVNYLSTVFDIDYADGFARANVAIYVFNSQGQLVLIGGDSNVAEDQPLGLDGNGASDLSRGSAGTGDPFIGVTELANGTYYIAVANESQVPTVMNQFNVAAAAAPGLRLEPIDSVTRLFEDRIGTSGGGTASAPSQGVLFDPNNAIIPYTLNDMILYKMVPAGVNNNAVGFGNPFDGKQYNLFGASGIGFQNFSFAPNGEMFAYSPLGSQPNADADLSYNYYRINSETGVPTLLGPSGVQTFHVNIGQNGARTVVDSNDGLNILGSTIQDSNRGYFVANRPINRALGGAGVTGQNAYFQNIIYAFNPTTGRADGLTSPNRASVTVNNVTVDSRANGAGTQIVERGYIETGVLAGTQRIGNRLAIRDASQIQADGTSIANVVDGSSFAIQTSLAASPIQFEMDSGPVLTFISDPQNGVYPVDGLTFSLTTPSGTQRYEIETGPVVQIDSRLIADGATVQVTDSNGASRVFEFDSNNRLGTTGSVRVSYVNGASSSQLAEALARAINGAGFDVTSSATAGQGRVDLVGDSATTPVTVAGAGLTVVGSHGLRDTTIPAENLIRVSESSTSADLAKAVAAATGGAAAGNRVNYANVTSVGVAALASRGLVSLNDTGNVATASGVSSGIAVRYLVTDTAEALALRIASVINSTVSIQTQGITATADGNLLALNGAILNGANNSISTSAFAIAGLPPGGLVTGLATVDGTLYAVSNQGGLYRTGDLTNAVEGNIGTYIATATDLIGLNFVGLSAGPRNLEAGNTGLPGRFANMLFGVTADGELYAFNTAGVLQPVFAGGATHINIGSGVTDIDFSTLDLNLWHATGTRGADPGHGINAAANGARGATPGGTSLYFGAERVQNAFNNPATDPFTLPRQDGQPVLRTYNFPGGAKGAIESNTINLAGYSAADRPMLYFNYFLQSDNVDSVSDSIPDQDAFRVYVITDDGVHHLLATNNNAKGASAAFDDEFDDPAQSTDPGTARLFADQGRVDVQRLFDSTNNWRQARVSLAPFAGQRNLKLRVEFSTAASFDDGSVRLRTVAGNRLQDGDRLTINGETFEIDLGTTLTAPSGAEISKYYNRPEATATDRVTIVVGGVTYLLNDGRRTPAATDVNVLLEGLNGKFLSQLTASEVAETLAEAMTTNGLPLVPRPYSFAGEPGNNELYLAPVIPTVPGNSLISGTGTLSANTDADLYRLDLAAGAKISITAASTNGSVFPVNVRLFDAQGNELARNTPGLPLEYTSAIAKTIYIGYSGGLNTDYNPMVAGSGTPGFVGDYTTAITMLADFRVIQTAGELQIAGGVSASQGLQHNLFLIQGTPGTRGIPIVVDAAMSAAEVAQRLQLVLAERFSGGVLTAYPVHENTITLAGLSVTTPGPFGQVNTTWDRYGSSGQTATRSDRRASTNAFEGVYLDDFVIGFAERGEMATFTPDVAGSPTQVSRNTTFSADQSLNLTVPARVDTRTQIGNYQLEIRDGSEYVNNTLAAAGNASGTDLRFRTFDTNLRLGAGLSFQVSAAADIVDGSTFTLSNGSQSVTFEYDIVSSAEYPATGSADGVQQGSIKIRVPALASLGKRTHGSIDDGSSTIARNIIDAINSQLVRQVLGVTATFADGVDSVNSNLVNLSGAVQFVGARNGVKTPASLSFKVNGAGAINDGDTFTLSDGKRTFTFEYDQYTGFTTGTNPEPIGANGVESGNIPILVPRPSLLTTPGVDGSLEISQRIVNAINDLHRRGLFDVTAAFFGGSTVIDTTRINVNGIAIELTGNVAFVPENQHKGINSVTKLDTPKRGDSNRDRSDQGVILVENSRVVHSRENGIDLNYGQTAVAASMPGVGSGAVEAGGNVSNLRELPTAVHYPRTLAELNVDSLVPGVVLQNNILAYNAEVGINIVGLPSSFGNLPAQFAGAQGRSNVSAAEPVAFDRIVNNTIVGGSVSANAPGASAVFNSIEFPLGSMAFADSVTSFTRGQGVSDVFATPDRAIGVPDAIGKGVEPVDPNTPGLTPTPFLGTASLGRGGSIVLQFTDNFLTGSGDARPDLAVFETGAIESVQVEVSRDNRTYFNVGIVSGSNHLVDLDAFNFGVNERFSFVRLTDLRQGASTSGPAGADIDAVGALSSVPAYSYLPGQQGIKTEHAVAPTLLNNVIANTQTGIQISDRGNQTVIGGTAFYRNGRTVSNNVNRLNQSSSIVVDSSIDLFVDPVSLLFTPRSGAPLIDSSIDSVLDRGSLTVVKNSIGLSPSPILAPLLDNSGQLRVDDPSVSPPPGVGENVFKDRGAIDRGDSVGPRAVLVSPFAPESGTGSNQAVTAVGTIYDSFEIKLIDGIGPSEPSPGVGINDSSVLSDGIIVTRDGVRLIEQRDYTVEYDKSNNILRIVSTAGIWQDNSVYTISILGQRDKVLKFTAASTLTDGRITVVRGDNSGVIGRLEAELGVTVSVQLNGLALDQQTIDIFDGTNTITFELDSDGVVADNNRMVSLSSQASAAEVVAALAAAIQASGLNVTVNLPTTDRFGIPTMPVLQLLGASTFIAATRGQTTDASSIFRVAGSVGTEFGFGLQIATDGNAIDTNLVTSGLPFAISRNGQLLRRFELISNGLPTAGSTAIPYNPSGTIDELANAIVAAVRAVSTDLNPVNLGEGRISFGGDVTFAIDDFVASGSGQVGLRAVGVAGQPAATPVVIPIRATAEEVAQLYDAKLRQLASLGVNTEVIGSRVLLTGVTSVTGGGVPDTLYIQDQSGNMLQSNTTNNDGRTSLTVFVGGGIDFGDAPDSTLLKSSRAAGGPMARIIDGFQIGDANTAEQDALVGNSDDDDDDGIVIANATAVANSTLDLTVTINANREFYLDIWVDWNNDGVFNTATDVYRFSSANAPVTSGRLSVGAGTNSLALNVPANAQTGQRYMRFRLTEAVTGANTLGVNQTAYETVNGSQVVVAGEIVDLPILVQSNPYQNAVINNDVNESGAVTPLDALNIINLIAKYQASAIPLNPMTPEVAALISGFKPDVNGDGAVTALDALRVINFIANTRRVPASPEGEANRNIFHAVGDGLLASPLTVATSNVSTSSADEPIVEAGMPVAPPAAATSSNSVFDSANVVALDDVLDDIADDGRDSSDTDTDTDADADADADAVDSVFATLGAGV